MHSISADCLFEFPPYGAAKGTHYNYQIYLSIMCFGLISITSFKLLILPVLQSVIASGIYEYLKEECLMPNDKLSLSFEKCVTEALCRAIQRYKNFDKDKADALSHDEIKYYLRVLKDELVNLEPVDRKTYIDKNLYKFFKEEVKKSPTALNHLSFDLVMKCIKQHSITLDILKSIQPKIEHIIENTETLLDETNEIKADIQSLKTSISTFQNASYNFDIQCDDTIDLICPIPVKVALREDVVKYCKQILDSEHVLHIYGTFKSGKSVLACLIAQKYQDYTKIRIGLDYKSQITVQSLLQAIGIKGKKIVIIDGLQQTDSDRLGNICNYIIRFANTNTLIIIASCESFASISLNRQSIITEVESTQLSEGDVLSLVDSSKGSWGRLVYQITSGNPQLVQLAISFLESRNYNLTDKDLYNLFVFNGDMDISTQCRKVLSRMLPDKDSQNLLNRLLLLGPVFTKEECEIVANVSPIIELPHTLLANMTGTWIKENGVNYEITPLLRKSVKPDLNIYVKRDCCNAIADHIVNTKSLSANDIMLVFTLYMTGGLYEKMAELYIDTLLYLYEHQALKSAFGSLLKGFWHDLPLPNELHLSTKISIRSIQLSLFGISEPGEFDNTADELYQLIDNADADTQRQLNSSYNVLSGYYLVSGNVEKQIICASKILPSEITEELNLKLSSEQIFLVQMNQVKDFKNLCLLMESQAKGEFVLYDLYSDAVHCAINHVIEKLSEEDQINVLDIIIAKSHDLGLDNLYPFATCAVAIKMHIHSTKKEIEEVHYLYTNNADLLKYELGYLQLNYAYAVALEENGLANDAGNYFIKATEIRNPTISSFTSLHSNIAAAKYVGKTGPQRVVKMLCDFMKSPKFGQYLMESQMMLFYGTLSIAYWFNNQRKEAMQMNNIITDYVWKNRYDVGDECKEIIIRQGAMLNQYFHLTLYDAQDSENIPLKYYLFTYSIRDILDLYSPTRIWGCLALTSLLNDLEFGNNDITYSYTQKALEFCKTADSSVSQIINIMSTMIPLLLQKEDWDAVEYLVVTSASSMLKLADRPKGSEDNFLCSALLYMACTRAEKHNKGEYVDDDRIRAIVAKFLEVIGKPKLEKEILQALSDESPEYAKIENDVLKTISYLWHIDNFSSPNLVILMHRLYRVLSQNWKQHSLIESANNTLISIINHRLLINPDAFNLLYSNPDILIDDALKKIGFESTHRLIIAYNFLLKNPPTVNGELEDFLCP